LRARSFSQMRCVFPTLNCKRVAVVQPGIFCRWKSRDRELFLISRVLIQFIDNLQCVFSMCTLIPRLSSLNGITRLVFYRCAVFPLSHNSGCSGTRGSDGQYSSNMVHGVGDFCCYSLLLDFVQRVGLGILHLYSMTTLLHRFAFRARIFAPFSPTLFLWSLFLAQKSSTRETV
jgi:hypothetical protein